MGLKALQAGGKAKEVRAKRFETAARVVDVAKREGVDFVILAGDLFEHHDVDEAVVWKTVAVLDGFAPIPVFVLPGNTIHSSRGAPGTDRAGNRLAAT
jgi:DNA repair exonuclease SbcCD nuclease subunit